MVDGGHAGGTSDAPVETGTGIGHGTGLGHGTGPGGGPVRLPDSPQEEVD